MKLLEHRPAPKRPRKEDNQLLCAQALLQSRLDTLLVHALDDIREAADTLGFICDIPEADNVFNNLQAQVILTRKEQA